MKNRRGIIFYANRGITLVELMVVIAAMGIIIGVSMPTIRSVGSGIGLHIDSIQIEQDIKYTQQLSLMRGENYKLEINTDKNYYYIKPASSAARKSVKIVYLSKDVYVSYCSLNGGGDHYYIEFNSR